MARLLFAVAIFVGIIGTSLSVRAQTPDALKGADKSLYESLRKGDTAPDTKEAKDVIGKEAKYLSAQLIDPQRLNTDTLAIAVENAIKELPVQKFPPKKEDGDVKPNLIAFAGEMGHAMVTELQPRLKHPNIAVRVNAARMLAVVAQIGADEVAAPAIAIIEDPKESEAVKHWALETLKNIFAYVPEPSIPEKSAFRPQKKADERKAIQVLCDFVLRTPNIDGLSQEEINTYHYNRLVAVRALGHVRTHRVRFQENVFAKPAWVLLKVANRDGLVPVPELKERADAIYAFTQLFPVTRANVDREINMEYATDRLTAAILDIVTAKVNPPQNLALQSLSMAWPYTFALWSIGLEQLQKNVTDSQLNGADAVRTAYARIRTDLLDPLRSNAAGVTPDIQNFQAWFVSNRTKATELYTGDPSSKVNPVK
ncbi:MAG: hypothetical protein ACJ8C4_06835 [Gemmataceae bacterium]